jgi:CxxC motif-containing protein (DUF1111 family)
MGSFNRNLLAACSTAALTVTALAVPAGPAGAQLFNPAQQVNPTTGVPSNQPSNFEGFAAQGVTDPGVRGGAAGAGGELPGLNQDETNFFLQSRKRFQEIDTVNGTTPTDVDVNPGDVTTANGFTTQNTNGGLGPSFNGNSCAQCHIFPALGGGSDPVTNPQVTLATLDGANNTVPPFVANNGPIREARFPFDAQGNPDGGVHDLFVIAGRTDATNQPNANTGTNTTCTVPQTNFPNQIANNNIIFRIPISVFGDGLVENIGELTLQADSAAQATAAANFGITTGRFNHEGNTGTIARFGWKAQNKSLLLFSGEAYNVEMGVSNEIFQNERTEQFQSGGNNQTAAAIRNCLFNPTPEDSESINGHTPASNSPVSDFASDITNFSAFMRLSNQPTPATATASTAAGATAFANIGCGVCHIPTHTTDASIFTNQSHVAVNTFSDFAIHDMGTVLADRVSQGQADGDDFRSAPLFGVGKRAFFLHDGRTFNLVTAIEDHASFGSEANEVIEHFNNLPATSQQNIINFLRSL